MLKSALSFILLLLFAFSACTPEKKLKEAEFLLVKNKIAADNKAIPVTDKIAYVVQPRPNNRTLGVFLGKVSIFQAMIPVEKPYFEKFKRKMRQTIGQYPILLDTLSNDLYVNKLNNAKIWVQNNFGEPPILLDSSLIDYSVKQIDLMMRKIGYFNAQTTFSVSFKGYQGKRATVFYEIEAGKPYRITDIQYHINDTVLARIILADTNNSLLQCGNIYDEYILDNERSRIEERLSNRGYIYFSKNNIRYEADTSLGDGNLSLRVVFQNHQYKIDDSTYAEQRFRCYKIETVDIQVFAPNLNYADFDTIYHTEVLNKTDTNTYRIILPANTKLYKPSALVYPLFFGTSDVYSNRRTRFSYDRYTDMRNFEHVKIAYAETEESRANSLQDTGYLACKVQLSTLKRRGFEVEGLAKNTGGIYGLGAVFSVNDRNLFKAGEILTLRMNYIQELQTDSTWHFRNFEAGVNVSLEFPRFLFPVKQQNTPKNFRPKTLINVGANYIKHDYYSRLLLTTHFTYNWMQRLSSGKLTTHSLTPIDFSLIRMDNDSIFNHIIEQYQFSNRTREKYKNYFMFGLKYGFTLQRGNVYVFRTQLNHYGSLLYSLMSLGGTKAKNTKNDFGQYTIWEIPFESCISVDFDFVYNLVQKKRQALVYRLAAGVGAPTFNSSVIPYEKSFYLGGSNSMRAWRLRALGPGSYIDTSGAATALERVGDIKFETNLEYRMPIYKILTWGAFVDIGNIWLIKQSDDFVNGEFAFNRFYKELAIDAGIGLRLDLSFLIIRVDYALKIHNPAKSEGNRWQAFNWSNYEQFKADRAIVFGIGYPF